jgi:predicted dinucleotide-binding enzyme
MIVKTEPNKEETHMRIGFIGAGLIGGGLARLAIQAGRDVLVSNSRDPRTLFSLAAALQGRGHAGTAADRTGARGQVCTLNQRQQR